MQKHTQKNDWTCAEIERFHLELAKAEARISRAIFNSRKKRPLLELSKFGLTFAIIFVFVFVGMNFSAFEKRADFLLSKLGTSEPTVEQTQPAQIEIEKPRLVFVQNSAGSRLELPALPSEIAPPDNRLIIPSLKIHAPIKTPENVNLQLGDWEAIESQIQDTLQNGVVNFPGTAQPGETGNAFITGHSSYYPLLPGKYKDVFALLPEIQIGEKIEIWQNEKKFIYRVTSKKEVSPHDVNVLEDTDDSRLTLMTCVPVGTALRRLIVTAELEPNA
ncbi:MAG: sortase [Patescibacteria group bacterium]